MAGLFSFRRLKYLKTIFIFFILLATSISSFSQSRFDSLVNKINPDKWSRIVEKKVSRLEDKIIAKTEKTLRRLERTEKKIYRKQLNTKDSLIAKARLAELENKYQQLKGKIKNPSSLLPNAARQYLPHLDTLKTAFQFLNQSNISGNVKDALLKIESFEGKLQQAEEIRKLIRERREQLKQELENLGLVKELKKYNKEVYYYSEQLKEYKSILSDPKKIEKKAIELLSKTKFFQDFMRKNSMLALLFRLPCTDPNDPQYLASLAGLQTRAQVNNLIQQQVSSGGPNAQAQFRQSLQQAQAQLQELKNKVAQFGKGSSDDIMPDGFKPNNQKTKSFLRRLEYGTNIGTQKAQSFFPVTTDLGFSVGYKPNDKSVIGIGASYKIGWGKNWNNIRITNEGIGLRSFLDWKLKGSFWLSGGFELNRRTEFNSIAQLQNLNAWQQSGLIGLSKLISVKTKLFKKTKLQVLWDFLSSQQVPRTQAFVFRIGYNLK
jgi:hypothetical protein